MAKTSYNIDITVYVVDSLGLPFICIVPTTKSTSVKSHFRFRCVLISWVYCKWRESYGKQL